MLEILKKIVLSHKYSLIILFIFSLWLRLTRDNNIILSYIVLLLLYVVILFCVDLFFSKFYEEKKSTNDKERSKPVKQPQGTTRNIKRDAEHKNMYSGDRRSNLNRRPEEKRIQTQPDGIRESERKRWQEETSGQERRTAQARKTADFAVENDNRQYKETFSSAPSVKSARKIPNDIEKKLVRTAVTFNSIKNDSDRMDRIDNSSKRLYGTARKAYINNEEDLYTNKKRTNAEFQEKIEEDIKEDIKEEIKEEIKEDTQSVYDYYENNATSSDELEKISDDISKEIDKRINRSARTPRHRVIMYDDLHYNDDKPLNRNIPSKQPLQTVRNSQLQQQTPPRQIVTPKQTISEHNLEQNNENAKQTVSPTFPAQSAQKVQQSQSEHMRNISNVYREDAEDDQVTTDMAKIDRLFNHGRDNAEIDNDSKTGFLSRFKKKR